MRGSVTRLLLALGVLVLAQPVLAQAVVETDFTITVPNPSGEAIVESTTLVPLTEGVCYTWHLRVAKTKSDVAVTEVYTLPAAPQTWGLREDSDITISKDRRTATTPLLLTPEDGWIGNGWCVSEGDPEGEYSFEIRGGGTVLHRFVFELREI